ncbi:hypothetical protein CL633_04005 [bacterium]|nr:hypothetical protein [bacterium]|tara:strand:+ start:4077 stop:4310 length:234 start_codon:yes stop_codon:yes gene_type:complete
MYRTKMEKHPWLFTLTLAYTIGYTTALPAVGFGLLGRFLDKKYQTSPWILMISILFSMLLTFLWLYKELKMLIKKFN